MIIVEITNINHLTNENFSSAWQIHVSGLLMGRSHNEYTSRCVNYWHNLKNIQLNKTENLKQEKQKEKQPFLDFSDISSESNTDT